MKKFIFVSGFSRSGKDVVADEIESLGFVKYSFSQQLREIVANKLSIPVTWCSYPVNNEFKTPNGQLLSEYMMNVEEREKKKDPEVWAKKIVQQILYCTAKNIVFSDWQNLHELFCVQKAFPDAEIICVRVMRREQHFSPKPDISEYGLLGFPFQYTIENILGDYEYLTRQINSIVL